MRTVGNYEILDEIGRGGCGIVLRARPLSNARRLVAIKLLLKTKPETLARFQREERLLAELGASHGFVPLLEVGESAQGPFVVMPYMEGGTLRARLTQRPLEIEDALALGRAITAAMAKAHESGILHRDLKPENILFSKEGVPFVADLGVGRHFSQEITTKSLTLTHSGELLGTVGYMAPEQTLDSHSVGPSADVFSLGAILYELLSGSPAYVGDTTMEVLARASSGEFRSLARARPETPPWLVATVESAISPDPAKRPEDARALLRALDSPVPERRPWALVASVALVLVATGIACAIVARALRKQVAVASPSPVAPSPRPSVTPTPTPTPTPTRAPLPAIASTFARTTRTSLLSVLGTYTGRHAAFVSQATFTPDGRSVFSASLDKTLRLWDAETGEEQQSLAGDHGFYAAAASKDGTHLFAGTDQGDILVIDRATFSYRTLHSSEKKGAVYQITETATGQVWAAGSHGEARCWDLASGQLLHAFPTGVTCTISEDGKTLLTCDGKWVMVRDPETGAPVRPLLGPLSTTINSTVLARESGRVALQVQDGTIRILDLSSAESRTIDSHQPGIQGGLMISRNGRRGLLFSFEGMAQAYDLDAGTPIGPAFRNHTGWVTTGELSPSGERAVTGGNDQSVRVWDVATGRELWTRSGHLSRITGLSLLPSNNRLVSSSVDQTLKLWDLSNDSETATLGPSVMWIEGVAVSPDGKLAASIGGGRTRGKVKLAEIGLWDLSTGRSVTGDHEGELGGVVWAPDGSRFATCGTSSNGAGELIVWRRNEDNLEQVSHAGFPKGVKSAAFVPGGGFVVTPEAGQDTVYFLKEDMTAEGVLSLGGPLVASALAEDGSMLLAGFAHGEVSLYDLARRSEGVRVGNVPYPRAIAFVPGGREAIVACGDASIRLFDLSSRTEVDRIELRPTLDLVTALAVAPDGSGFFAGTLRGVILHFALTKEDGR